MKTLLVDIETGRLLPEMTRVHTIQIGVPGEVQRDGAGVAVYSDSAGLPPISEGLARIGDAERLVIHNGLGFDMPALNKIYPGSIRREQVFDTLVASRLFDPERRGHSLASLGESLGIPKGDYSGSWDTLTPEMVQYAIQDIVVLDAVFSHVSPVLSWGESCALEHNVTFILLKQEANGFGFDETAAEVLASTLRSEMEAVGEALAVLFPPIEREEAFIPKVNLPARGYSKGVPFIKRWMEPFNPNSRPQIAERLLRMGWVPRDMTETGQPQIDAGLLNKLADEGKYPGVDLLARHFRLVKQLSQVSDGDNGWLKLVSPDGRIYGRVNPNGAVTGRMSHFSPNVAQAEKEPRFRVLWVPRPGMVLVGCDADGLEARMLAHYLSFYDAGRMTDIILSGKKTDKTDIHSLNLAATQALGVPSRDAAKTVLYALIYGSGDFNLGHTIQDARRKAGLELLGVPPKKLGAKVRKALMDAIAGFPDLLAAVSKRAKERGYLVGLDGRRIRVRSEHSALNALLQGGGAIAMKKALSILVFDTAPAHGLILGENWNLCANVHDEWQAETAPENAETLGTCMAQSIADAGAFYRLNCALAGSHAIGNSWAETH